MNCSRRDWYLWLPALVASSGLATENAPLPSKTFRFEELPVRTSGDNRFRPILEGATHQGFRVEMHESDLAPGGMPHAAHRHAHEEVFLVREGTLEVAIGGRSSRLGPGSVAFISSNDEHGVRNAGTGHAKYFVVALGSDK
jgi:quercetin dioxygenase-like cupin family protein